MSAMSTVFFEFLRELRWHCNLTDAQVQRAVAEATHHAAYRYAFSRRLIDQPLMQNVLADLCLESEAATALAIRLARGFAQAATSESGANSADRRGTGNAPANFGVRLRSRRRTIGWDAILAIGGTGRAAESGIGEYYGRRRWRIQGTGGRGGSCESEAHPRACKKFNFLAALSRLRSQARGPEREPGLAIDKSLAAAIAQGARRRLR